MPDPPRAHAPVDGLVEQVAELAELVLGHPVHLFAGRRGIPVAEEAARAALEEERMTGRHAPDRLEVGLLPVRPSVTDVIGECGAVQRRRHALAAQERLDRGREQELVAAVGVEEGVGPERVAREQSRALVAISDRDGVDALDPVQGVSAPSLVCPEDEAGVVVIVPRFRKRAAEVRPVVEHAVEEHGEPAGRRALHAALLRATSSASGRRRPTHVPSTSRLVARALASIALTPRSPTRRRPASGACRRSPACTSPGSASNRSSIAGSSCGAVGLGLEQLPQRRGGAVELVYPVRPQIHYDEPVVKTSANDVGAGPCHSTPFSLSWRSPDPNIRAPLPLVERCDG